MRSANAQVFLNKPIFLDACVLDLSKLKMVHAWYRGIKPQFDRGGSSLKLCMSDTDSFILLVEYLDSLRCPYQDLTDLAPVLDISIYGPQHPIFTRNPDREEWLLAHQRANKGSLGLLKDECGNKTLEHVICLRFVTHTSHFTSPTTPPTSYCSKHPSFIPSRPKSYAYRLDNDDTKKALKGIGRSVTKNEIYFDDY